MKYFISFILTGRRQEKEVLAQHIRDAALGETVMLNSYFPELIEGKRFTHITEIINEKGKRTYWLTDDYKVKQDD